jgi:hypothetical protein
MKNVANYQDWEPCEPRTTAVPDNQELEITPRQYLAFAREDIAESTSQRALINSLGHAKRAIHLQTDIVLTTFGFKDPGGLPFPRKLELCTSCGIVAPGILKRLNNLRNVVEHEYRCPSLDEVQNAIDIAELFIEASRGLLRLFPRSLRLQSPANQPKTALYLRLDPHTGALNICQCGPPPAGDEYSDIPSSNPLYSGWIALMVRMTR